MGMLKESDETKTVVNELFVASLNTPRDSELYNFSGAYAENEKEKDNLRSYYNGSRFC
jgi:hypothetical protein